MCMIIKPTLPHCVGDRRAFPQQVNRITRALDLSQVVMRHSDDLQKASLCRTGRDRRGLVAQSCSNFWITSYETLIDEPSDKRLGVFKSWKFPFPAIQQKGALRYLR